MRLPAHRCGRFGSRQQCLNAMDPYCGWNRQKNECTNTPNRNPRAAYWSQDAITCPVLTDPVCKKTFLRVPICVTRHRADFACFQFCSQRIKFQIDGTLLTSSSSSLDEAKTGLWKS